MTTGNTNTLNSANENIRRQAETPEARRERLRRRLLSEVLEERIHRGE
ncbi:MAG TPA: hypothetical protein PK765_02845 [bacterium]|nr:hypothetical protein [bacterium]